VCLCLPFCEIAGFLFHACACVPSFLPQHTYTPHEHIHTHHSCKYKRIHTRACKSNPTTHASHAHTGPVDAAYKAIDSLVRVETELTDYSGMCIGFVFMNVHVSGYVCVCACACKQRQFLGSCMRDVDCLPCECVLGVVRSRILHKLMQGRSVQLLGNRGGCM
jgi:hypothetical protein